MGWVRLYHYFRHRIFRQPGSAYKITAGLAIGASISFTPFLGTHFIQALFLARLLKANYVASLVGTLWGNPWTFPFLFWCSYTVGEAIFALFGATDVILLPEGWTLGYLFSHPAKLLWPMTIGGYIAALLFWPLAYIILYYPVRQARQAYRLRRLKRIKKRRENRA